MTVRELLKKDLGNRVILRKVGRNLTVRGHTVLIIWTLIDAGWELSVCDGWMNFRKVVEGQMARTALILDLDTGVPRAFAPWVRIMPWGERWLAKV